MTATTTVEMERLLPGPIEQVWDYLTKPELLATWLGDANPGTNHEIKRCEPPAMLEYAWNGDSAVRFELEARGQDVLLKLTHRFIGVCTVLVVGLAIFMLSQPSNPVPERQQLGIVDSAPSLKFHSSAPEPLYGMLGGRC
jgi:hypothetical protein